MAINYFLGWNQVDLETELRAAQEDLAAGRTITSVRAGEAGNSSTIQMSPQERIKMLLQALNAIDPTTYPADSIHAITQTQASFSTYW